MIAGNPNIKASAKPRNVQSYMKLSIDKNIPKKPLMTKEEYENQIKLRDKVIWQSKN